MWGKFLCCIGLHNLVYWDEFYPSIRAEIVTEYKFVAICSRCQKDLGTKHVVWNPGTKQFEAANIIKHNLKL